MASRLREHKRKAVVLVTLQTMVAIPTLGESPWLPDMVASIMADPGVDRLVILDNTPGDRFVFQVETLDNTWARRDIHKWMVHKVSGSVYHLWNLAIRMARLNYAPSDSVSLVILNDDLELPPGACGSLSVARREGAWAILGAGYGEQPEDTQEVWGSYRHGGLGGFAFAVDPRAVEPIPACYSWWYGDDHLINETRANGGRVGVCGTVRVTHHASTTGNAHWDRLAPLVALDTEAYRERWGDT